MLLAFALLAQSSLPLYLYACYLSGDSVQELADEYNLSPHWVQERIEAVRMALNMQVRLKINPNSSHFRLLGSSSETVAPNRLTRSPEARTFSDSSLAQHGF
jgi:hypothetical protein